MAGRFLQRLTQAVLVSAFGALIAPNAAVAEIARTHTQPKVRSIAFERLPAPTPESIVPSATPRSLLPVALKFPVPTPVEVLPQTDLQGLLGDLEAIAQQAAVATEVAPVESESLHAVLDAELDAIVRQDGELAAAAVELWDRLEAELATIGPRSEVPAPGSLAAQLDTELAAAVVAANTWAEANQSLRQTLDTELAAL